MKTKPFVSVLDEVLAIEQVAPVLEKLGYHSCLLPPEYVPVEMMAGIMFSTSVIRELRRELARDFTLRCLQLAILLADFDIDGNEITQAQREARYEG